MLARNSIVALPMKNKSKERRPQCTWLFGDGGDGGGLTLPEDNKRLRRPRQPIAGESPFSRRLFSTANSVARILDGRLLSEDVFPMLACDEAKDRCSTSYLGTRLQPPSSSPPAQTRPKTALHSILTKYMSPTDLHQIKEISNEIKTKTPSPCYRCLRIFCPSTAIDLIFANAHYHAR